MEKGEKMRKNFSLIGLFLIVAILLSCTPKSVPLKETIPTETQSQILKLNDKEAWELEWEKILAEAKKEGTVVILCGDASVQAPLTQEFKKKYGINAEFVIGRGNERWAKVVAERRANLYMNDIWLSGIDTMINQLKATGASDPLYPDLVLPEVVDGKYWQAGRLSWVDKDRYVLRFLGGFSAPLAINTNLVQVAEVRSYKDLLNPKWKGKMTMNDPTVSGTGQSWVANMLASGKLDSDFMVKLIAQEPLLLRDQRLQADWLARGKYPIAIAPKGDVVREFSGLGSPLQLIMPVEGTHVAEGGGYISILNRAPHPNAAKVFINWLLSREGQMVHSRAYGKPSLRVDVPDDFIDPAERPRPGMSFYEQDEKFYVEGKPRFMQLAREIFRPLTQ